MIHYSNIKALFLAARATGSHSINHFLNRVNGSNLEYDNTTIIPESAANQQNTVIVSVANPYTRVYDKWKGRNEWLTKVNRANEILTFENFVKQGNYGEDLQIISDTLAQNSIKPDVVLRLEYIKSDVKLIPGVDLTNKTHLFGFTRYIAFDGAVSRASEWKSNYNQELADIVYSKFQNDFTAYNYSKDSWK